MSRALLRTEDSKNVEDCKFCVSQHLRFEAKKVIGNQDFWYPSWGNNTKKITSKQKFSQLTKSTKNPKSYKLATQKSQLSALPPLAPALSAISHNPASEETAQIPGQAHKQAVRHGSFLKQGVLIQTPNSGALVLRTPTKGHHTPN